MGGWKRGRTRVNVIGRVEKRVCTHRSKWAGARRKWLDETARFWRRAAACLHGRAGLGGAYKSRTRLQDFYARSKILFCAAKTNCPVKLQNACHTFTRSRWENLVCWFDGSWTGREPRISRTRSRAFRILSVPLQSTIALLRGPGSDAKRRLVASRLCINGAR
jgi:hypothetical protein